MKESSGARIARRRGRAHGKNYARSCAGAIRKSRSWRDAILGDSIEPAMKNCDVAIDFSHADSIDEICRAALQDCKSLVIGTTGHSEEQRNTIEETAQSVPVVFASNFSVGVNVLFWLTQKAAESLGPDFNAEIVETHHQMKKDAPAEQPKRLPRF